MLSEALDITIESRGDSVWLILHGPFHREQVPSFRAKIEGFIADGHRNIVIDMEGITSMNEVVAPMFLGLLNLIRGKNGDIKLIFKNSIISTAFAPYRNLFSVYPDSQSLLSNSFMQTIRRRGMLLTKKTGVRLSVPVAMFLLVIIMGWFVSLIVIISMQKQQIRTQEKEIHAFLQWKKNAEIEIGEMKNRIKPMEQLGLLSDTVARKR
jgi:anti-anti-sigma regulatory factor